jgi:SAM-dependent methyltransferase
MYVGSDLRSRYASRFGLAARERRHRLLAPLVGLRPDHRVVDLGCANLGLRGLEPHLDITGVDRVPRPDYPGPFVMADVTEPLPFEDDQFDLAYASSLVEHLPRESRALFASEVRRVARGYLVQTPAYSFPIEPHALLPFVHWLPRPAQRRLWSAGVSLEMEEVELLKKRELHALFPGPIARERWGPLTKSWVAYRAIQPGVASGDFLDSRP